MTLELPRSVCEEITAHALESFPQECCGIIVRREGQHEVVRVTNIQNQKHAEDPEHFPRTAGTAYMMGPEAAPILVDHERGRLVVEAIYHSHSQCEAYFSAEDRKRATVRGEASYPDAAQIVISVFDREVRAAKAFRWNERRRDFEEVELRVQS